MPQGFVSLLSMEFWIPKREEPGKTTRHPVLKYRVPHRSQCVMDRLVHGVEVTELSTNKQHSLSHTGLGSSSLVAHVLHYPPPPTRTALTYNANPSGRGMHPSYRTEGYACADIRGDQPVYSKWQLAFHQIKNGTTDKLRTRGRRFNCPSNH